MYLNEVTSNSDKLRNRFLELVTKDIKEPDKMLSIYEFIQNCNEIIDFNILFRLVHLRNGKILGLRYGNKFDTMDDFYNSNERFL